MATESIIIPIQAGNPVSFRVGAEGITASGIAFWRECVRKYLLSLREQPATRKTYDAALKAFLKWITDNGLHNRPLVIDDVEDYRNYLHSRLNINNSEETYTLINGKTEKLIELSTINLYIVAVKNFFKYLEDKRIYENIARNLKLYRAERMDFVKMHLSAEEARALIDFFVNQPYAETPNNPHAKIEHFRNIAIVNLMLHNGLRTVEISRARMNGLKIEYGGHILYVRGKGRQTANDFVVLSNKVYDSIQEYISLLGPVSNELPLFVTTAKGKLGQEMTPRRIQEIIKTALVGIGLIGKEYSPHSLRHTTAVHLLKQKASIYDIQLSLRHKGPQVTERYLWSAQKEERIHNATENLLDDIF